MTTREYHTCARCGVADEAVKTRCIVYKGSTGSEVPVEDGFGWMHEQPRGCEVAALARENAELRAREEQVAVEFAICLEAGQFPKAMFPTWRQAFAAFRQSDAYPK